MTRALKATLVRSLNGRLQRHKDCVAALGLRRMHQTVTLPDNVQVRGMLRTVGYMLLVEEVEHAPE